MNAELSKAQRLILVGEAFRPSTPIDDLDLFAGRDEQRGEFISAVTQAGRHVGLYGERGVGKTSLARVMAAVFGGLRGFQAAMVSCSTEENFSTLWHNIFRRLGREIEGGGAVSATAIESLGAHLARSRAAESGRLVRQLTQHCNEQEVDLWLKHWPYSKAEKRAAEAVLGRETTTKRP